MWQPVRLQEQPFLLEQLQSSIPPYRVTMRRRTLEPPAELSTACKACPIPLPVLNFRTVPLPADSSRSPMTIALADAATRALISEPVRTYQPSTQSLAT